MMLEWICLLGLAVLTGIYAVFWIEAKSAAGSQGEREGAKECPDRPRDTRGVVDERAPGTGQTRV